ncbi:MAG TPA: endonuclease V [Gemmatimonadaceae bacterium]
MAIQRRLRERLVPHPPPGFAPRLVAGADLSMARFATTGHAAIVVLDADTLDTVAHGDATVTLHFPYVPGLLTFRELPALERAWARLETRPDVLIFDGVGYAHPRRAGCVNPLPAARCLTNVGPPDAPVRLPPNRRAATRDSGGPSPVAP